MIEFPEQVIKLWLRTQIPEVFEHVCGGDAEWIALIPPSTMSDEVESLFLRWVTKHSSIKRTTLDDGSVILSCRCSEGTA
jgi:hypothetical protein